MHIWYIHPYGGGPGLGLYDRPWQLARAWQQQGHTVTVFIAAFHHLLEKNVTPEPDFLLEGVRYVAVPTRPYSGNGVARILNLLDFTKNLYGAGERFGRDVAKPDVVIASSPHPFAIFPAHRLARSHGARLVFEVRDIWPMSITEILGTSPLHPFVQMCALAERFALTRSDLVASPLPRLDQYLADRGFGKKPFVWVPNGTGDDAKVTLSPQSDAALKAMSTLAIWRNEGRKIIVHAGSLGKPNAIDNLLHAFAYGRDNGGAGKCRIILLGAGEQRAQLEQLATTLGLSDVFFAGAVPKHDVAAILTQVDIGYAGIRPLDRLYRYGVSLNKFSDYFSAGLPVVLPIEPCGDPVSEAGGGIARRSDTPQQLWAAFEELLSLTPQERKSMGSRGSSYMAREYDYGAIAKKYISSIANSG